MSLSKTKIPGASDGLSPHENGPLGFGGGGSTDALFTGDAGNNTINGTSSADFFNMNDGGNDTVNGLGGDDVTTFGASFTAADSVNGGSATDSVILNGDYSAGVTLAATTMTNVEEIDLLGATNNYKLTMNDGNVASGLSLIVSAAGLDALHGLTFDGSAESNGFFNITGGAGQDIITVRGNGNTVNGNGGNDVVTVSGGAAGHDVVNGGAGNDIANFTSLFNASDQFDGGTGTDTLWLDGNYAAGVVLGATTLLNVEGINLVNGHAYTLTTNDATIGAGQHFLIDGSGLFLTAYTLKVNGAAETNGNFQIEAGAGNDVLTTGAGNDGIDGNNGDDIINPGTGTDSVNGGIGNDIINMGAAFDASDQLNGAAGLNTLNLQGDYSAGVTLGATTIQNIQTINLNGDFSFDLTFDDANYAAATTATIKDSGLTAADTVTIDATAETNAIYNLVFTGPEHFDIALGAGNDVVTVAKQISASDVFDGGGSFDTLHFTGGNAGHLFLGTSTIQNFTLVTFEGTSNYDVVLSDAMFTTGAVQIWDGGQASGSLVIDDSAELDTGVSYKFTGAETRTILGGAQNDFFQMMGTLKATDQIDGGGGSQNGLSLDGDYSAGLTLAATTLSNITKLSVQLGHDYTIVTNDANFVAGPEVFVQTAVGFSNKLNFNGSAETDANFNITGGSGNDTLIGGQAADSISGGGGNDLIQGGGGDDFINMMLGTYTFADGINGGAGTDTLTITGDYSAGVTLGSNIASIEEIFVGGPNDFKFTTQNALVAAGQSLAINAANLSGGHKLTFDGSAENDGTFVVYTGSGDDTVSTGAGDDKMYFTTGTETAHGGGGNDLFYFLTGGIDGADTLDGGAGNGDSLVLQNIGNTTIIFADTTIQNIENIVVLDGFSYSLATADGNIAAGKTLTVDASQLTAPNALDFDGSFELDGMFVLKGGAGGDGMTGGDGADQIFGNDGNDELNGGAGDDTIDGGTGFNQIDGGDGNDIIDISQGTGDMVSAGDGDDLIIAGDTLKGGPIGMAQVKGGHPGQVQGGLLGGAEIDGGVGSDTVEVSGDYSAGFTFTPSSMINVEYFIVTDGTFSDSFKSDDTTVAAGANLTVDATVMGPANSLTFNGSAETDGSFDFLAGQGNDLLTGGAQADTFDFSHGGNDTGTGGAGNDLFLMGGALTAGDKILGGSNSDTVALDGDYSAGLTLGATTLTSVETMTFSPRFSYKLTMDDGNVGAGKTLTLDGSKLNVDHWINIDGSAETNGRYVMLGGDGNDSLTGGAGADRLQGGHGADLLTGGAAVDVFVYKAATDSSGGNHDTIVGLDFAADQIDLNKAVTGIDAAIGTGSLSDASFDADLAAVFTAPHLGKHHAALFTADAGTLAGHTFLVVDANGTAGYQVGGDYVFDVTGAANTASLSITDFV
jgi:Ca2+-binding RTX toxin-like protein